MRRRERWGAEEAGSRLNRAIVSAPEVVDPATSTLLWRVRDLEGTRSANSTPLTSGKASAGGRKHSRSPKHAAARMSTAKCRDRPGHPLRLPTAHAVASANSGGRHRQRTAQLPRHGRGRRDAPLPAGEPLRGAAGRLARGAAGGPPADGPPLRRGAAGGAPGRGRRSPGVDRRDRRARPPGSCGARSRCRPACSASPQSGPRPGSWRPAADRCSGTARPPVIREVERGLPAGLRDLADRVRRCFVYVPFGSRDWRDPEVEDALDAVVRATLHRRPVRVRYHSASGRRRRLTLEPLAIVLYRDSLYALARAPRRHAGARLYAVHRMRDAEVDRDVTFEVPADFDAAASFGTGSGSGCHRRGRRRSGSRSPRRSLALRGSAAGPGSASSSGKAFGR